DAVFAFQILRPFHFAIRSGQATEITLGTQRIDFTIVDQRRGARAQRIRDGVDTVVFVLPENLAVGVVQAEDPFLSRYFAAQENVGRVLGVFGENAVHDVHPALRHGGTA